MTGHTMEEGYESLKQIEENLSQKAKGGKLSPLDAAMLKDAKDFSNMMKQFGLVDTTKLSK